MQITFLIHGELDSEHLRAEIDNREVRFISSMFRKSGSSIVLSDRFMFNLTLDEFDRLWRVADITSRTGGDTHGS